MHLKALGVRCAAGLFLLTSWCAHAAEFSLHSGGDKTVGVLISGPIERGDYERWAKFLVGGKPFRLTNMLAGRLYLDSPGGNVTEALKIASIVDRAFTSTVVQNGATCASSCFLIFAAGADRTLENEARLGVHRIALNTDDLDVAKIDKVVRPASQSVEAYLQKVGVPRKILDKMNETSSSDIFWVTNNWLFNEDLWATFLYRPGFIDIASKKCGPDPYYEAVKRNQKPTSELASKGKQWVACVGDVQTANQELAVSAVMNTLVSASLKRP